MEVSDVLLILESDIWVVIGAIIAILTLLATYFKIRKAVVIATSNAETAALRDLNHWFVKYSEEGGSEDLFSWDKVPGKGSDRLLRYLWDDNDIDWAKNARIRKSLDGKSIWIRKGINSAKLSIDVAGENATLEIRDGSGRTYDLKVRDVHGEQKIHKEYTKKKFLYLQLALNILEHLVKDVKRGVYPFDEYLHDFLPMTFYYFVELEKCRGFKKAKEHIFQHESLLPLFEIYEKKSNAFLIIKNDRTPEPV
ncbi:hypothetical protein C5S35_00620 [Candidatus Methanophagaceae archaeon]|nr:hypothetical protein C5S35_00620 [Methanophagales archaeon]